MVRPGWSTSLCVVLASVFLHGHHSLPSEYDVKNPIVLRGRIVRVEWVNPHTFIYLEVRDKAGTLQTWQVEGGSPSTLLRANLPRERLVIGSEIALSAFPAHNRPLKAAGNEITFPDGTTRVMISSPDPTPPRAPQPAEPVDFVELAWTAFPYIGGSIPVAVLLLGLYIWRRQEVRK